MSIPDDTNDFKRLKDELRQLKRSNAPWYFESSLHQRLHGNRRRRTRLRPIEPWPIIALTFGTLCILAVAGYVVMVNTNLFPRGGSPVPALAPASDSLRPTVRHDSTAALQPALRQLGIKGPAGARPTRVAVTDTLRGGRRASDSTAFGRHPGGEQPTRRQGIKSPSGAPDSLGAPSDSVRQMKAEPPPQ